MKTDSRIVVTADGSHSLFNEQAGQHYHSIFGARQESERVFMELGLQEAFDRFTETPLRVFEMGFGTGLNAVMTAQEAENRQRPVLYTTVEAFPIPLDEAYQLNFDEVLGTRYTYALHEAPWQIPTVINPYFTLTKQERQLQTFSTDGAFHVVYYDAFAPEAQPELWTADLFQHVAGMMVSNGILTTYCSKGYVQRNLKAAGFRVEKHPGPARKREILRAVKI
ncbi:tRNA (5-methylaminomethyl-2-thiouridine)(34)-methyltransferase MnmD [Arsenicibacter rosenii]|uniref:tRNA 5-methylaminomethyl-2-thiouridine biosynthesis bifunctional protein mnmC tRNA mnm(5)s(2)U biosynthesis bifunctional protein n=1 Tax=Arsenicibacter rosenii TaxID=1750698 RepID=A0A1S2VAQ7_9BACT|nr:tRNA (5-methylaminomethyl-2-thiouridine)(34)-methyltransferase MnmD [Arsenicibacter rosenii]OIN55814.1 tRNA 5-methylaminomethyl-2-thiouridine biosynthesis bifunctional protein mnmC tRNA mnm(5)s(2)U biosynthesis bifunctional protein [Arsenicibacter rosenii]